jgi:hypothetical protein
MKKRSVHQHLDKVHLMVLKNWGSWVSQFTRKYTDRPKAIFWWNYKVTEILFCG